MTVVLRGLFQNHFKMVYKNIYIYANKYSYLLLCIIVTTFYCIFIYNTVERFVDNKQRWKVTNYIYSRYCN